MELNPGLFNGKHEVKGTDTVLQQKAAQNENTFTVRIMGTVLTNPCAN